MCAEENTRPSGCGDSLRPFFVIYSAVDPLEGTSCISPTGFGGEKITLPREYVLRVSYEE